VLLSGDAGTALAALKEQDGPDLMVQGSSDLLQTLLAGDLVDRFRVWTFPVLLGRGKRLFGTGTVPGGLRLVDSQISTTGLVIATYERAGDVPVGPSSSTSRPRRRSGGGRACEADDHVRSGGDVHRVAAGEDVGRDVGQAGHGQAHQRVPERQPGLWLQWL
jgi:hypothetical protein